VAGPEGVGFFKTSIFIFAKSFVRICKKCGHKQKCGMANTSQMQFKIISRKETADGPFSEKLPEKGNSKRM
jgi:hypothetical protein